MPKTVTFSHSLDASLREFCMTRRGDGSLYVRVVFVEVEQVNGAPLASREIVYEGSTNDAEWKNLQNIIDAHEKRILTRDYGD